MEFKVSLDYIVKSILEKRAEKRKPLRGAVHDDDGLNI